MYSEEFVNYLLKYQNDDLKKKEKKETLSVRWKDLKKNKYATVPINYK